MARRLPLCAWCGGTLARQARVLVTWERLRQKPVVGWHLISDCANRDPIYEHILRCIGDRRDWRLHLAAIRERGRGRVLQRPNGETEEVG
jgi:hypothetical protein